MLDTVALPCRAIFVEADMFFSVSLFHTYGHPKPETKKDSHQNVATAVTTYRDMSLLLSFSSKSMLLGSKSRQRYFSWF